MNVILTPNAKANVARLEYSRSRKTHERYESFWQERNADFIPAGVFRTGRPTFLEIGAGSGTFFLALARKHTDTQFIAVERDRMRGNRLVRRSKKAALPNLAAFRGNAIPALLNGIPDSSLDRIYILYPCPWPKNSQRKHRWYLHPIMPHLVRTLKTGGLLIWASDQEFYINEARYICGKHFPFKELVHGQLSQNPYNDLAEFPEGRTKFEGEFLRTGQPCYELIVQKS